MDTKMCSVLNNVFVCSLLFSYYIVSTVCLEHIETPIAVPAISKSADTKQNGAGFGDNLRHGTSRQGTLVSLNVQNDIDKKSNQNEHRCNGRDTIEIAVDQPIPVDVSTDYTVGSNPLIEGHGNINTGQDLPKDEQLNSIIKVYINGDKASEEQTEVGQLSPQNKMRRRYNVGPDGEKPDNSRGVVSDFKRHKRSPAWIYSYIRQHGRHGRRTRKRYRDFWDWYSPYKNSFDPLASHIIG